MTSLLVCQEGCSPRYNSCQSVQCFLVPSCTECTARLLLRSCLSSSLSNGRNPIGGRDHCVLHPPHFHIIYTVAECHCKCLLVANFIHPGTGFLLQVHVPALIDPQVCLDALKLLIYIAKCGQYCKCG